MIATDGGSLLVESGSVTLPATLALETTDGRALRFDGWRRDGDAVVGAAAGVTARCTWTTRRGGLALSVTLASSGRGKLELRGARLAFDVTALVGRRAPIALKIAYCGAHSRSDISRSLARPIAGDDVLVGWWVGSLAADSSVVLGALDFRHWLTSIEHRSTSISAYEHLEGRALRSSDPIALAPLWLAVAEGAPFDQLEAYADEVGAVHGARPPRPTCGWGTWGHFSEEIDAGLLRETVTTLEGIRGVAEAVSLVQIDDGWSEMLASGRVSASWRPNRRFPSGIAPLAAEIASTGRDCGLWMIPFTVNEGSALALEHPEFLVRDGKGRPHRVGGMSSYCIDPTHARAAEWLTDLFADVREWGVRYVKLDFLRALLAAEPSHPVDGLDSPRRYDSGEGKVQAYRRGLELIRGAMGNDAYLLGCSAPAGPGIGLVSAHRIGPDIEPAWIGKMAGVRDAARAVAANWFWQGRTWVNDPDYVIPCESEDLTRFWAIIVALSGGSMILSADLAEMDEWVESLFAFIAPPIGIAARPLDLFENGPEPRLWSLPLSKGERSWQIVAVLNWTEHPRNTRLDLRQLGFGDARVHLWDVFRRRHRFAAGEAEVFVEPHAVVLLRITAATDAPTVVGTDVHFGQGFLEIAQERWDATAATLRLTGALRPGNAYVWSPASIRRVAIAPEEVSTLTFEHT